MAIIVRLDKGENPWFNRMLRAVINTYGDKYPSINEHKQNFEHKFGVRVIVENGRWAAVEFKDEFELIKWM